MNIVLKGRVFLSKGSEGAVGFSSRLITTFEKYGFSKKTYFSYLIGKD
jgi:hypothetical protein